MLLVGIVGGFVGEARAQRVAVSRFSGPQGGRVRSAVVSSLERNGVEVVPQREVNAVAREVAGRTNLRAEDYPAVAQELNIKAFVSGRISRSGRRWTVRVTVRNGADGMRLGTASWGSRTVGQLRGASRNAYNRLAETLELATSPMGGGHTEEPQVIEAPDGEVPWYERTQPGEEEQAEEEQDEEDDEQEEPDDGARPVYERMRFGLLAGTNRRSMTTPVLVDPRLRTPFPTEIDADGDGNPRNDLIAETREYNSGGLGHLELGFTAEIFPGGFAEVPVVPWLGIRIDYRHSVGLATRGDRCIGAQEPMGSVARCDGDPTVAVDTSQSEFYGGARADVNLGDDLRGPFVTADVGYGIFKFELSPNDLLSLDRNTIVPPLDYRYVQLGVGGRYGLHEMVSLGVDFGYRLGLGVGDAARRIWGGTTSDTAGFTVGASLRHDMTYLEQGVYVIVGVQFARFSTKFRGQTACRNPSPVDQTCPRDDLWEPWPEAVEAEQSVVIGGIPETVQDNYLRLSLTIGYALR